MLRGREGIKIDSQHLDTIPHKLHLLGQAVKKGHEVKGVKNPER